MRASKRKITLKNIILFTIRIFRHKYWAFYYCCCAGIPLRGIVHDWSRYSFTEFWTGVRYYTPNKSSYEMETEEKGYSKAFHHHIRKNRHHCEHWTYTDNDGNMVHLCMPYLDTLEMFCNYLAAGKSYNPSGFSYERELEWWESQTERQKNMHPVQRMFLDICFNSLVCEGKIDRYKLKYLYKNILYMYNMGFLNNRPKRIRR